MIEGYLYKDSVAVTDKICVLIPKLGDVIDNEDEYYGMVSIFTAMPIDFMVQLDDIGIDFTEINEWDLFLILFNGLREQDTSMILGDLDLSKFSPGINESNGNTVLIDREHDIVIDRAIHGLIADTLRKIHHLEKNIRKPANEEAKEFLLKRAREKLKRRRKRKQTSQLEELIVAMVNTEQFKYDFVGIRELTIYQFNESVRQVIKKVDYDNRMYGVYTGSIDIKTMSQDDLNWLTHK